MREAARTRQQQLSLTLVLCQLGGMLQRLARLAHAPELVEQIGPHGVHQVVALQGRLLRQLIDQWQRGGGAEGHADGDRAVERDHG